MSEHLGNKVTKRMILPDGIHLNLRIYHSTELQQLYFANQGRLVQVAYDPADPNFIYVQAGHNSTSPYIRVPRADRRSDLPPIRHTHLQRPQGTSSILYKLMRVKGSRSGYE